MVIASGGGAMPNSSERRLPLQAAVLVIGERTESASPGAAEYLNWPPKGPLPPLDVWLESGGVLRERLQGASPWELVQAGPVRVTTRSGERHLIDPSVLLLSRGPPSSFIVSWMPRAEPFDADSRDLSIATVVHELSNPITAAMANVEFARRALQDSATRASSALDDALFALGHTAELLHDLRRVAQHGAAATVEVSLGAAVEEVIRMARHRTQHVAVSAEGGPVKVYISKSRLQQIVLNLLTNSADAMSQTGGTISIRWRTESRALILEVEDEGPGIPPEQLDQLFQPLATTKGASGMGLGLFVSQFLARQLGGNLTFRPAHSGGACFVLRIPGVEAAALL